MRALLPLGAVMLGVMQRRVGRSVPGHPWPARLRLNARNQLRPSVWRVGSKRIELSGFMLAVQAHLTELQGRAGHWAEKHLMGCKELEQ